MQREEFQGTWWLPPGATEVRNGSLKIEPSGQATLRLHGSFHDHRFIAPAPIAEDVIHGRADDGTPITLLSACHGITNGLAQQYWSRHTIVGVHLTSDTVIATARVTATELDNFLGVTGYDTHGQPTPDVLGTADIDGTIITFHRTPPDHAACIDNQPFTCMTVAGSLRWQELWELITTIDAFLSFSTQADDALITVVIELGNATARVMTPTRARATQRAPDRGPNELVLWRDDIDDMTGTFARWCALTTRSPRVLNAYFGFQRRPGEIEVALPFIVQALESYHRDSTSFDQRGLRKELFGAIKKRLVPIVESEFPDSVEWFHRALGNHKTLRTRLEELYQQYEGTMRPIAELSELTGRATDLRNHFAHAKQGELNHDEVEAAFWCGQQLAFLCRAVILQELGFTGERTTSLLERHWTYERLALRLRAATMANNTVHPP